MTTTTTILSDRVLILSTETPYKFQTGDDVELVPNLKGRPRAFIFTNECELPIIASTDGENTIRTNELHLHTSRLSALGKSATLNASGENGTEPAVTTERDLVDGTSGSAIFVSTADLAAGGDIWLLSNGGKGADGFVDPTNHLPPGRNGNAGGGGPIRLLYRNSFDRIVDIAETIFSHTYRKDMAIINNTGIDIPTDQNRFWGRELRPGEPEAQLKQLQDLFAAMKADPLLQQVRASPAGTSWDGTGQMGWFDVERAHVHIEPGYIDPGEGPLPRDFDFDHPPEWFLAPDMGLLRYMKSFEQLLDGVRKIEGAPNEIVLSAGSQSRGYDQIVNLKASCDGARGGGWGHGFVSGEGTVKDHNGLDMGSDAGPGIFSWNKMTSVSVRNSDECILHPDQVKMTIRGIENKYLLGTDESLFSASEDLQVVIARLKFLDELMPTDAIYQAYAAKEHRDLAVLPSTNDVPTSISSMKSSLALARQYASQLAKGQDFYQHAKNWVPRCSFTLYENDLDSILTAFKDVEAGYKNYQQMAKSQQTLKDQIAAAVTAATNGQEQAEKDRDLLVKELQGAEAQIVILSNGLPGMLTALNDGLKGMAETIRNSFSVSFSDLLGAAGQMAFCPNIGMAVVQGANLYNQAKTEVKDDSGSIVKKDYVINQIMDLKADLDGLNEAITANKNSPFFDVADPGGVKLIGEEKDIMALIGKYRGVIGGDEVQHFRGLFDAYISQVLQRNNEVVHYNACANQYVKAMLQIDTCTKMVADLGVKQIEKVNEAIPTLAVEVEAEYLRAVSRVLELFYDTRRALSFWSLNLSLGSLDMLRSKGFSRADLSKDFAAEIIAIKTDFTRAVNGFRSNAASFGNAGQPTRQPFKVELNDDQLDSLMSGTTGANKEYSVMINLNPVYKSTHVTESPFSMCADVRITNVRFYIEGAKTKNGRLSILLEHMGNETIVDTSNQAYQFRHDKLTFSFQYVLSTGVIISDVDVSSQYQDLYALPGPFALWRVSVSSVFNDNPDLSKITKAWFEFSGHRRNFE